MSTLLHEAREVVAADAAGKCLAITVVPAYGCVALDRPRVIELLALLLRRAISSAVQGGRVAVTAHESERHAVFAVFDNGPATSSSLDAEVQELAGSLGGSLRSESRPGSGTVVLFTVPRCL